MQRVLASIPRQAPIPAELRNEQELSRRSGFFDDVSPAPSASQLAAAIALAVHRGLVEQPVRKQLALR
jgi:hypothetical protein